MSTAQITTPQPDAIVNEPGKIQSLEGLRGLAALLVFFVHFNTAFGVYADPGSAVASFFQFASTMGRSGVNLLFLLSGYLIYGGLIRKPTGYGYFLHRRLKRIYPAFLCVFILHLLLRLTFFPEAALPSSPWDASVYIFQNLALLPGLLRIKPLITVAWSLSYQAFLYCTIPLLIGITRMRRWSSTARFNFFLGLAVLYGILHLLFVDVSIPGIALFPAAHPRMIMFAVGILAYEARTFELIKRFASGGACVVCAFSGLMAYYLFQTNPWLLSHLLTAIWSVAALGLCSFCLVLNSFVPAGMTQRALSWAPLRSLGNISYSFYLIQSLTLHALLAVAARLWAPVRMPPVLLPGIFAAALAVTAGAAFLLFRLVEKPCSTGTTGS